MSYLGARWASVSSRVVISLRAMVLAGIAGALVVAMLALALVAAPAFGAASVAAHHGNSKQSLLAYEPNIICPPAPQPC